jgi:mono/diheme cytochrome c family protein
MRLLGAGAFGAALLWSIPAWAAAGNIEAGRQLVNTSCTTCHLAPEVRGGTDAAPPFVVIARNNRNRPGWIRTWLTDPHPPMQGINLTRQQIDDVTAYLMSLARE